MSEAFANFSREAVYRVGEIDALDKIETKLSKKPEMAAALAVVQKEKKQKRKKLTFEEFMLLEGFYDF